MFIWTQFKLHSKPSLILRGIVSVEFSQRVNNNRKSFDQKNEKWAVRYDPKTKNNNSPSDTPMNRPTLSKKKLMSKSKMKTHIDRVLQPQINRLWPPTAGDYGKRKILLKSPPEFGEYASCTCVERSCVLHNDNTHIVHVATVEKFSIKHNHDSPDLSP